MDGAGSTQLPDGLSPGLTRFFEELSAEDRENLLDMLRDQHTFLAEDMNDVLAILRDLGA